MPYYITDKYADCNGWAVIDAAGDAFGCHTTKQAAIDQAVAISLADDEEFMGERNLDGDRAVICDIDGTLINSGELNDKVYEFVSSQDALLFIVTGRPESERDATVQELDALGVSYDKLEMNDGSTADSPDYKKGVAEKLLETYNVVLAVENDEQTRANYEALGIDAVDPADVESVDSEGAGDVQAVDGEDEPRGRREFLTRTNPAGFEIRETSDGMRFSGYAAVFNSPSEPLPFTERIAPGAFKRSLRSRNDIKLLWGHDSNAILGSTRAKTLTLVEDDKGLRVDALLPNTNLGRDAAELLRRGDVDAMSFGFNVIKDSWSSDGSERTLHSVRLFEVSIVGWPAYSATAGTATVRSFDKLVARAGVDAKEFEAALIKLENGETLDDSSRNLLEGVIESLSEEKTFAPDQQDSVFTDMAMLELKKKKLELLKNGFNPLD